MHTEHIRDVHAILEDRFVHDFRLSIFGLTETHLHSDVDTAEGKTRWWERRVHAFSFECEFCLAVVFLEQNAEPHFSLGLGIMCSAKLAMTSASLHFQAPKNRWSEEMKASKPLFQSQYKVTGPTSHPMAAIISHTLGGLFWSKVCDPNPVTWPSSHTEQAW